MAMTHYYDGGVPGSTLRWEVGRNEQGSETLAHEVSEGSKASCRLISADALWRVVEALLRLGRYVQTVQMDNRHQVHIRPAEPGDADQVWPLARDFATAFDPQREAFDVTWRRLGESSGTLVAVAESGQEVVGYLLANCHVTFLANGPVAWVEEVMVQETHRRSGIGQKLMNYAESWARESGAAHVALASRRAGTFYLALGYEDSAVFFKKTLS